MMKGKEKIYFLLDRIQEKRELKPKWQPVLIHPAIDLHNKYPKVELVQLFTKLQEEEFILRITTWPEVSQWSSLDHERGYYGLEILPKFDDYYLKMQREPEYYAFTGKKPTNDPINPLVIYNKLENLSGINLTNIIHIVKLIEEQLQLEQSEKITISFVSSANEIEGYENEDIIDITNTYRRGLGYLKKIGVIKEYTTADTSMDSEIILNIPSFFDMLEQTNKLVQNEREDKKENKNKENKNMETKQQSNTDVIYEVKYSDKNREILVNNFLLAKPDFNSENDIVFDYLFKHPNQTFTQEQIEKDVIKAKLNKTLHKIVENLGFKGDLKKVFFSVSKSIQFRNPITQKDLEDLGIGKIKLILK